MASYQVRDLTPLDYDFCQEIIQEPFYAQLFAISALEELHPLCTTATVATDESGEVIAFLMTADRAQFFADLPAKQQPASAPLTKYPAPFSAYLQQFYGTATPEFTTHFVRAFGALPGQQEALELLIQQFFNADPLNEVLLFVNHPYQSLPAYVRDYFPEVSREGPLPAGCCAVLCCLRYDVLPPLEVRSAQMKDHDDLVLIFEAQNTDLRRKYGEFFVADLISQSDAEPHQKLALVGLDFEQNSTEIRAPVSFVYAEKFSPFSEDDNVALQNLNSTHCLERYGIQHIPPDCMAFVRATATLPQAASRCGDLIAGIFEKWDDIEALILSIPSSASCEEMQLLRLFTFVEPRSCLSPRESLFVCHKASVLGQIQVSGLTTTEQVNNIVSYITESIEHQNQMKAEPARYYNLEVLSADAARGTVVAFGWNDGKKVPVAVAVVDMNVATQQDTKVMRTYIDEYGKQALQKADGRICRPKITAHVDSSYITSSSIYEPPVCLSCKTWCRIHYDEQLDTCAYLRGLIIDPLYLQFKNQILASFMRVCGVDGFLVAIGFEVQRFIQPVYDGDRFVRFESDPNGIFSSFEKQLLRQADYIPAVRLLPDPAQTFYDGQQGSSYGEAPKPPPQFASCANAMYGPDSALHAARKADEAQFNAKCQNDQELDIQMSAIRSLTPEFSLYCIRPATRMALYYPPLTVNNADDSKTMILKPPTMLTDRLVVVGSGIGLISALQTLQEAHHIADFRCVSVVHPPPGIITPFNFKFDYEFAYDHGESLASVRDRPVALFFDVFVGDLQEVDLNGGVLKLASGSQVCFDMLLICPDGADAESMRDVSNFNLNSAVAFRYGVVDPSELNKQAGLFQAGTTVSVINDRGYREQEICQVLQEPKYYVQLLSALFTEHFGQTRAEQQEETAQDAKQHSKPHMKSPQRLAAYTAHDDLDLLQNLKLRLHSRTFFRYLTYSKPLMRRQTAALYASTYVQNLEWCVMNLVSQTVKKQLLQKARAKARAQPGSFASPGPGPFASPGPSGAHPGPSGQQNYYNYAKPNQPGTPLSNTPALQEQTDEVENNAEAAEETKSTVIFNGYRSLSPGAKSAQFIYIMDPEVAAELPLITQKLAEVVREASKQLFPVLYDPRPPRAGKSLATQSISATIIDAARTSVCVYGDTFESFAVIKALLDAGIPPCSLVLLLPSDPSAEVNFEDAAQDNIIENMLNSAGGSCARTAARPGSLIPYVLSKIAAERRAGADAETSAKSTAQTAEKRCEAFPADLHRALLNYIQLLGVNVERNVKITDVICSVNGTNQKQLARQEDGQDDYSDNDASEDDDFSDYDDYNEAEEEFDEQREITYEMLEKSLELLSDLDERDVVFYKKYPGFSEELDQLDDVCDQILLGNADSVLKRALADGDENFDVAELNVYERQAELQLLLRKRVFKLYLAYNKIYNKKFGSINPDTEQRTNAMLRKCQNGGSLCGLRVQILSKSDQSMDNQKSNIPLGNSNIGRLYYNNTTSSGANIRLTISNADLQSAATPATCKDIFCCAVFLTETFTVPNNISSALMKSDLVFDKALIVNSYAQTSDTRVYASGNIGKLARATLLRRMRGVGGSNSGWMENVTQLPLSPVLLTQDPSKPVVTWSLYSPAETAQYAAFKMITRRLTDFGSTSDSGLVPEFSRPLVLSAKVVGGHIFRVSRPLRDIRDARLLSQKLFRVIETGDLNNIDENSRWCRMEIDPLGVIDSFTVFSHAALPANYKSLVFDVVGMPVALYNQLESRWQREHGVSDLIDFLSGIQLQPLYSPQMREKLNQCLIDLVTFSKLQPALEQAKQCIPAHAKGVADVPEAGLAKDLGASILRSDPAAWQQIQKMLVNVADEFAQKWQERFYELKRGVESRGKVEFKRE